MTLRSAENGCQGSEPGASRIARTTTNGLPAAAGASHADSISAAMAPELDRSLARAPAPSTGERTDVIGPVCTRNPARRSMAAITSAPGHWARTLPSRARSSVATTSSPGSSSGDSAPPKPATATPAARAVASDVAARRARRGPTPERTTRAPGARAFSARSSAAMGAISNRSLTAPPPRSPVRTRATPAPHPPRRARIGPLPPWSPASRCR